MNTEQLQELKSGAENGKFVAPETLLELIELVERATAAPSESIDSEEFRQYLVEETVLSRLVARIDAWGQQRYETGRKDGHEAGYVAACEEDPHGYRARAERAEAALEEWTHTNKVDELGREVGRLRAELASRPAVDLSGLQCYLAWANDDNEVVLIPRPDGDLCKVADVQALLSGKAEAPTGCSKDPNCCPNNEGYGCDCSVSATTTASADGLPLMPERDGDWAGDDWFTTYTLQAYARQARADALEEAARLCEAQINLPAEIMAAVRGCAAAVRALNKKVGA